MKWSEAQSKLKNAQGYYNTATCKKLKSYGLYVYWNDYDQDFFIGGDGFGYIQNYNFPFDLNKQDWSVKKREKKLKEDKSKKARKEKRKDEKSVRDYYKKKEDEKREGKNNYDKRKRKDIKKEKEKEENRRRQQSWNMMDNYYKTRRG